MNDETSKKLIKVLTIISIILIVAFFSNIILFIGGVFASVTTFIFLVYYSITNYLESFSWFNVRLFNALLIGLLIGGVINVLIRIAMKLIPKSQVIKYAERRNLYQESEVAINLFLSSLEKNIDQIISPLEKLSKVKFPSSIYELFESEEISDENKYKVQLAHHWLGHIYASEYYGKYDFNLAVYHYQKSKINSSINLGKLYYHGGTNSYTNINKSNANHSKAIKYFFAALNENRYESATYIGLILRRGSVKSRIGLVRVNYLSDDINSKRTLDRELLTEAFGYLKTASSNNNVAKFYLGAMNYLGEGCKQDFESARKYLEESASSFYDEEIKYLVTIYSEGKGTEVDFVKALTYSLIYIQFDALQENQIEYFKSKLTSIQISDAYLNASNYVSNQLYVDYLMLSNSLGSLKAKELLIDLYKYGLNGFVEKDFKMALKLGFEALEKNSAYAHHVLALMHEYGEGVESNVGEAMRLYRVASELGSTEALVNLAINYHYGLGVEANIQIATEYYLKAVEKDSHRAMYNLALIYLGDKKIEYAMELLNKVVSAPSSPLSKEAHSTLGQLYFDGKLIDQDYQLAFNNFQLSENYSDTFGRLGVLYYFGYGTTRDYKLAKIYLEQYLSNNESSYHQYLLGWIYLNGQDTNVNLNLATYYLEKSASKKMKDSIFLLSDIYLGNYDKSHKDLIQSLKWLYFAANNDYNDAYEKMKPIKDNLSSEGIEKAQQLASEIS